MCSAFFIYEGSKTGAEEHIMKNNRFLMVLLVVVTLTLALTSCGGEGGGIPPRNMGVGQVRQVSGESGRTAVLRSIIITPSTPLGINPGTQLQFTAKGSYSDNSVQDITTLATWSSSDPSVATVSNEFVSIGLATAISKGYCSISVTFKGFSVSTIIGVY